MGSGGRGEGLAREPVTVDALAERVRPVTLARDRQLPVLPALEPLFPGGALRRGSVVSVDAAPGARGVAGVAPGVTTLALAVAAGASQAGSWVAVMGLGSLGLVAAAHLGVAFDRLVLVTDPPTGPPTGGVPQERRPQPPGTMGWAPVVAALVDGFDVVLLAAGPGVRRRAADVRRLVARVRERGAVLVTVGGDLPGQPGNVRLTVETAAWQGLDNGYLESRRVAVVGSGRGEASRPRRAELWLPDVTGRVTAVEPSADPISLNDRRPAGAARPRALRRTAPASRTQVLEPSVPGRRVGPEVAPALAEPPVAGRRDGEDAASGLAGPPVAGRRGGEDAASGLAGPPVASRRGGEDAASGLAESPVARRRGAATRRGEVGVALGGEPVGAGASG
jgi:hypothetical protein